MEIVAESHGNGDVDYEAVGLEPGSRSRVRAGVENGRIWVNALHVATVEEARALIECIQDAIDFKERTLT